MYLISLLASRVPIDRLITLISIPISSAIVFTWNGFLYWYAKFPIKSMVVIVLPSFLDYPARTRDSAWACFPWCTSASWLFWGCHWVEMDGINEPVWYFHFHCFFSDQFDILAACKLELIEVVASVKVMRIDLSQPIFGSLHPYQDYYTQCFIHNIIYSTQKCFMLVGIIYLIDYYYSINPVFQYTQTAFEQVIGSFMRVNAAPALSVCIIRVVTAVRIVNGILITRWLFWSQITPNPLQEYILQWLVFWSWHLASIILILETR